MRTITISRDGYGPLTLDPQTLTIAKTSGAAEVTLPIGWRIADFSADTWEVTLDPLALDFDGDQLFALLDVAGNVIGSERVRLRLELRSAFEPAKVVLPVRNRVDEFGEVQPTRDMLSRTVTAMPAPLQRTLFAGLYSDVVFLKAEGALRGGMCSGMARWAIARGAGKEPAPANLEAARKQVELFHGRQLRDRALLAAVPWFLRGSPAAAYRAVRHDLLCTGITERALDIAVPKLWRRDLPSAIVQEGHTVVPYRLVQDSPSHAELTVYDPNHPDAIDSDHERVMTFDLRRDRYAYGTLVKMSQSNVGIIAVGQDAYASAGTAYLAAIGSLLLAPRKALAALLNRAR